jgi:hypothetical protein
MSHFNQKKKVFNHSTISNFTKINSWVKVSDLLRCDATSMAIWLPTFRNSVVVFIFMCLKVLSLWSLHLGWFYTSAQNAAFETLAVKRLFIIYSVASQPHADRAPQPHADRAPQPHADRASQLHADRAPQPHADRAPQPRRFFYTCVWTARFSSLLGFKKWTLFRSDVLRGFYCWRM